MMKKNVEWDRQRGMRLLLRAFANLRGLQPKSGLGSREVVLNIRGPRRRYAVLKEFAPGRTVKQKRTADGSILQYSYRM